MESVSSASLRESEGGALSEVWGTPQKLITFSQLKDPKSLLQVVIVN